MPFVRKPILASACWILAAALSASAGTASGDQPLGAVPADLGSASLPEATPAYDCVVDPARSVQVASPVRGILSEVVVKRGQVVEKDQVIAHLEDSVEASTVELNRVRATDRAAVKAAEDRLALAQKSLDRALQLEESDVVSQKILDELRTAHDVAESELAQARVTRTLAKLELARSQAILDLRTVKSPVSGVVTERALSGGEFVSEDQHIATIVELDPLHVETFVPQEHYGSIEVGQSASIELTAPTGERRDAKVTVVDPVFDPASGTFGVRLELANPNGDLPGGMRCKVAF